MNTETPVTRDEAVSALKKELPSVVETVTLASQRLSKTAIHLRSSLSYLDTHTEGKEGDQIPESVVHFLTALRECQKSIDQAAHIIEHVEICAGYIEVAASEMDRPEPSKA